MTLYTIDGLVKKAIEQGFDCRYDIDRKAFVFVTNDFESVRQFLDEHYGVMIEQIDPFNNDMFTKNYSIIPFSYIIIGGRNDEAK